MLPLSRPHILRVVAALTAMLAIACAQPEATPTSTPTSTAGTPNAEIIGLLATTDLSVGTNRVSFLLLSLDALITIPEASVTSLYSPADNVPPLVKETVVGLFHLWPYGTRGNYSMQLTFDVPGDWELDVNVQDADGTISTVRIPLKVKESSFTPAIGAQAPLAPNRILRDVTSLSQLSSGSSPDPELYQKTIAEAVTSNQPSLVVFASPALCTSPTCGPQVETVQSLKERYKDRANFIHVEVYDNPDEIQGDLSRALYSPVVEAWNLASIEGYLNESWVFILDREGRISSKYEGFASEEELEAGLLQVLQT